jgi:hypothetical protein
MAEDNGERPGGAEPLLMPIGIEADDPLAIFVEWAGEADTGHTPTYDRPSIQA